VPDSRHNAVRQAIIASELGAGKVQVDDLIIRRQGNEGRAHFSFPGLIVWLDGPQREREYWQTHPANRSYLFIGDIDYSQDGREATVEYVLSLGPEKTTGVQAVLRLEGHAWKIVEKTLTTGS